MLHVISILTLVASLLFGLFSPNYTMASHSIWVRGVETIIDIEKLSSVDGVYDSGTESDPVPVDLGDTIDYTIVVESDHTLENLKFIDVAAGRGFSVAIDNYGRLWSWGLNDMGQLGNGTISPSQSAHPDPECISEVAGSPLAGIHFVSVSAGVDHVLALDQNGDVWAWGRNNYNQLANGNTANTGTPAKVAGMVGRGSYLINAGGTHSMAVDRDGNLWTWGNNASGQIGDNTVTLRPAPVNVSTLNGFHIRTIAAGGSHSLSADGTQPNSGNGSGWGDSTYNQLGRQGNNRSPLGISLPSGIYFYELSAGTSHSLGLDNQGHVWVWGRNNVGQLGKGDYNNTGNNPATVMLNPSAFGNKLIVHVAAGGDYSFAIDTDGGVWAWGSNANGEFGTGNTTSSNVPVHLFALDGLGVKEIAPSLGDTHTLFIAGDGEIWAAGLNTYGQLGTLSSGSSFAPLKMIDDTEHFAPFKVIDFLPSGLINAGTPTVTDQWGNAVNLGDLTIDVSKVDGQDIVSYTFSRLPAGILHFNISAQVADYGLFVNSALFEAGTFCDPHLFETDNTYHEAIHEGSPRSFIEITKMVSGEEADLERLFDYTLTIEKPQGLSWDETSTPVGTLIDSDGYSVLGSVATASALSDPSWTYSFSLKHGQTLRMDDIHLPSDIEVLEFADEDYIASVEATAGATHAFRYSNALPDRTLSTRVHPLHDEGLFITFINRLYDPDEPPVPTTDDFMFYKVGSEGVPLSQVHFSLYECIDMDLFDGSVSIDPDDVDPNWTWFATAISEVDGEVLFEDLEIGRAYMLVETATNAGYRLPTGQWMIIIDEQGEPTITAHAAWYGALPPAFKLRSGTDEYELTNLLE
ncbi:MAG: SpaA isopeptide-forming pilin-related protein, partial [Actinomycetia bacterium]|nr:SpaA isopeptide-forming pilin-related protein [Actinomycetes bacterium]